MKSLIVVNLHMNFNGEANNTTGRIVLNKVGVSCFKDQSVNRAPKRLTGKVSAS